MCEAWSFVRVHLFTIFRFSSSMVLISIRVSGPASMIQIIQILQHPLLSTAVGLQGVQMRTMQMWLFIATCIQIHLIGSKATNQIHKKIFFYFLRDGRGQNPGPISTESYWEIFYLEFNFSTNSKNCHTQFANNFFDFLQVGLKNCCIYPYVCGTYQLR